MIKSFQFLLFWTFFSEFCSSFFQLSTSLAREEFLWLLQIKAFLFCDLFPPLKVSEVQDIARFFVLQQPKRWFCFTGQLLAAILSNPSDSFRRAGEGSVVAVVAFWCFCSTSAQRRNGCWWSVVLRSGCYDRGISQDAPVWHCDDWDVTNLWRFHLVPSCQGFKSIIHGILNILNSPCTF